MMVIPDRIPKMMKDMRRWVGWRYEQHVDMKTGEVTTKKPPYRVDGKGRANITKPGHWGTFEEAMEGYRQGLFDGVGFALSKTDYIAGIDLDHCRDPETGRLEDWASRIIDSFRTYAEVSPSGTGAHIVLKGHRPANAGCRKGKVEIYQLDRYLTVTGQPLNNVTTVNRCQNALDALCAELWPPRHEVAAAVPERGKQTKLTDEAVVKKLLMAPHRAALWRGDTSAYDHDHSRADAALLAHLAYFTNSDEMQMDRVFRQSGLYRAKWDRADYSRTSIRNACKFMGGKGYSGRVAKSVSGPKAKVSPRH